MTSLLKNYSAMPWQHYVVSFRTVLRPFFSVTYKNNGDADLKVLRNFEIKDCYGTSDDKFTAGNENILAGQTFVLDSIPISPFDTQATDTAKFEIKSYLVTTNSNDNKWNDTIRYYQVFRNYFAYDDGSSEAGYGLQGQGSENGMVAYGFTAYKPDTVKGISIYFNPAVNDTTLSYYFKLAVWADNKGQPGKILDIEANDDFTPKRARLNQFYNYALSSPVPVSGKFYVGWVQVTATLPDYFLNVGFDLNTNNQQNLFFNVAGVWQPSQMKGSLMMRPILGWFEPTILAVKTLTQSSFRVYPNPASDYITIDGVTGSSGMPASVSLYNITGKLVLSTTLRENTVNVSNLPDGLYILKVNSTVQKILIQH
jgi:hypothetical protein